MQATTEAGENTRVIDLADLRGNDAFPACAAIYSRNCDNPQLLSPNVMRWRENIHLTRLDLCRQFWLRQKKKLRCKIGELFEPLLRHHHGDDYLAVFGDHPWQCLLYLHYRLRHRDRGLYFLNSPINRNIFKSLDWDCWFEAQTTLFEHLQAIGCRGFNIDSVRARQAQLRRFIERIDIDNPQAMRAADANSIQRRFGKWLGLVWRWSFTHSSSLDGFPWIPLQEPAPPSCSRELEYPVNQWDCIEPLLREDMARLCTLFSEDDCEHVNCMIWEITLFNHERIEIELSFRHPYSLHRDRPGFSTALYQARYVYEGVMRELVARDRDLDLPEQMPFIGWSLVVRERIQLAPALWDLFALESDGVDYQRVYALQNKLPLAFECFRLQTSFFPERSFAGMAPGSDQPDEIDDRQWAASAFNKPLFYYPEPLPIEMPTRMQKIFLERNSTRWWLGEDALRSIRDYYLVRHPRDGASWVYRNGDGLWFKQGEFF